jgi:putative FmdB family regulatory protein
MPLYEYVCEKCETRFERLRRISAIDDPATCPEGHTGGRRVVSVFAALTKNSNGEANSLGGGGCGGCGGGCTSCACSVN